MKRKCKYCNKLIPKFSPATKVYCSNVCRNKAWRSRKENSKLWKVDLPELLVVNDWYKKSKLVIAQVTWSESPADSEHYALLKYVSNKGDCYWMAIDAHLEARHYGDEVDIVEKEGLKVLRWKYI